MPIIGYFKKSKTKRNIKKNNNVKEEKLLAKQKKTVSKPAKANVSQNFLSFKKFITYNLTPKILLLKIQVKT